MLIPNQTQPTTIFFGARSDIFNYLPCRPLHPTNTQFNQASNSKFDSKKEQYFR